MKVLIRFFWLLAAFFSIWPVQSFWAYTIHVFGDSHSWVFQRVSNCHVHHLGSVTMHRVGQDGLKCLNVLNYGVIENDVVIFVFGEIDVRCHIIKQMIEKNRELDEVIHKLVDRYLNTIEQNIKNYYRLFPIVYLVVPPSNAHFNPEYPYFGELQERVKITKKLNQYLKKEASRRGFAVLDIYDYYCDEYGVLDYNLSDGAVHISADHYGHLQYELMEVLPVLLSKFKI